jgi:hypothetical protein
MSVGCIRIGVEHVYTSTLFALSSSPPKFSVHFNRIVPFVLHGYETWSVAVREEQELRVFESGVLRKIFGLNREGKNLSTCHFGHY